MKPKYKVGEILIPRQLPSNLALPMDMDIIALVNKHFGCKFKVKKIVKIDSALHTWFEYHLVKESGKRERITISDRCSRYFKKLRHITFNFG